ncbi:MAG: transposase [bacterium]|nr:transposase [bacterium]
MTVRKIIFSVEEFYHLYSRGVDKRSIFPDDADRKRFVRLLLLCNGTKPVMYRETKKFSLKDVKTGQKLVAIGAYCLMPNHFHLLIKEITEGGIVKFMSKLLTAYSTYFNKKYERTGALFSSEFKSSHLDVDEYLKYIFAYIHLNPLKILNTNWKKENLDIPQAESFLNNYVYSSYLDYLSGNREERVILNTEVFPKYFNTIAEFKIDIRDWINFHDVPTEPSPR